MLDYSSRFIFLDFLEAIGINPELLTTLGCK